MNAWSCDGDESFGGPPPAGIGGGPPMLISPKQVLCWLDMQDPAILRRVMYHCKWVLEQRGLPADSVGFTDLMGGGDEGNFDEATPVPGTENRPDMGDMSGWYEGATKDEPAEGGEDGGPKKGALNSVQGGKVMKRGGGARIPPPTMFQQGGHLHTGPKMPMQWTPAGWFPKDNSHKVTTTIRPLPPPDIIPRNSEKYPEADADRGKLRMLESNKKMMDIEVQKICRKHKIWNLDRDNLDQYSEDARSRLKTALQCCGAAEKTLNEYREFLKEEKYKEWNDSQKDKQDEALKSMIGDMPQGVPHKRPDQDDDDEDGQEEGQE